MKNKNGWRGQIAGLALTAVVLGLGPVSMLRAEDGTYAAPPKGFQITWKREIREGDKVKSGTLVHRVTSSKDDEVIYKVIEPGGDVVRLLRGIFSYAYWRPDTG